MKKIILIIVSVFFIGCNNEDEPNVIAFEPIIVSPNLIVKKNLNGSEGLTEQNLVINNTNDWTNFKNQIDTYYQQFSINYSQQYFTETTIDFNSFIVIVVIDQIYGNGGHSIDITNITEFETNIVVTIENLQTGNTSSVVTQPYHIVKIPKTSKPIVFNKI